MVFCTECGTKHADGTKFCCECGTKLKIPDKAPSPKAPAPVQKKNPTSPARSKFLTSNNKPKPSGNYTGDGKAMPSYRGVSTASVEQKKEVKKPGWTPPVKKGVKNVVGSTMLTGHEKWAYYNIKLVCKARGRGITELKNALPMDKAGFVHFRIDAENVGNTGKGIITTANIILQWKGPNSPTMQKVRCNGSLQSALDKLEPNKGYIEVLGLKNLTTENIYDRWRPGSGSKVIDD
eukprot:CAMPEP_0184490404 /NCGR_PEP_ID=MMETSP0113_2-20130426/17820_1 /TAXON_ID=91329 /ORGANISM="Norrisiella sphaerica, Strain BC52" /LENGTH=234 /DNA_ID=CAMNT_0026874277 /DNA_START=16 /DNA_END=720 /DNA_ORIENTATION=-